MKILLKVFLVIIGIIILFVVFVKTTWDNPLLAPYPDIQANTDSAIVARGEYLVYGPAHCAECHFPPDKFEEALKGEKLPLSGGLIFDFDPIKLGFPNITPDEETGIGLLTDGQIARMLRYSVGHNGRYILPALMTFQETSDEDLTAIISYLRLQEPVTNKIEPTEYQFMARALIALGLLPIRDTTIVPAKSVTRDSTAEYGSYLVRGLSNCMGCHTKNDPLTGEITGEHFAGGMHFEPDPFTEGYAYISPNLTPDPETGIMASWDQETYIQRFKAGRVHRGSPMYWNSFANMDESDMKAIYKFLMSLEPVHNKVEKTVFAPGEDLPD
jgi:mono/diheme cytochrome c family protein